MKAYREIGTVEGYKSAIECYTEEYLLRKSNKQYNKAIDDLSNTLKENYDYLPQIFSQEAFGRYVDEYAEQLKEGVED